MSPKFTFRTHVRIPVSCFVDYVGDGLIGTGVVQDFSVDGWRISGEQPARVGMDLALRVMLPREPAPIEVEAATVQWVRGREFGVHIVRMSAEAEVRLRRWIESVLKSSRVV